MLRRLVRFASTDAAAGPKKRWKQNNLSSKSDDAIKEGLSWVAESRQLPPIAPELIPNLNHQVTYEPYDFSLSKQRWARRQPRQKHDRFSNSSVDPLSLWRYPDVLSEYITANGKILPSHMTGMSGHNHKRLAKAIRRARAAGLLSHVHRSVMGKLL